MRKSTSFRPIRIVPFVAALLPLPNALAQTPMAFGDSAHWAMYERYLKLDEALSSAGRAPEPHWLEGGRRFWFHSDVSDRSTIMLVDPSSGAMRQLFDVEPLRAALKAAGTADLPESGLPFESLELLDGERSVRIQTAQATFDLNLETFGLRLVAVQEPESPDAAAPSGFESPDGSQAAFTREGNVWMRCHETGRETQLTFDAGEFVLYTISDSWGGFWSPNSRHLVVVRRDRSSLVRSPIVDWLSPTEEVSYVARYNEFRDADQQILHWDSATEDLVPFDVDLRESDAVWLRILGWRPDASEIFIRRQVPEQRRLDVLAANPVTGDVRVVFTESGEVPPYVDLAYRFVDGGFILASDRDGHRHLYRYGFDGHALEQMTTGDLWMAGEIVAADEASGWLYFYAYADPTRPYDTHFCRVRRDGTGFTVLTDQEGVHRVTLSPDLTYFLDEHSSKVRPPQTDLKRADGTFIRTLTATDMAPLREQLRWVDAEEFVVKAADGETDLWGALYKPYDFDPSKKYPVVQFIYSTFFPGYDASWEAGRLQRIAQLGFITVHFAIRGEGGARSRAFRSAFYRRLGCCEHEDAAAVLGQLAAERPYMDLGRVGIVGGSWGGYHAARFMLMKPELFKVGIAERAWMDPRDLGVVRLMGTLEDNPRGYAHASNIPLADRLQGKLLLIVTTSDPYSGFASTLRMIDALIRAGKPHDVMVVPGVGHLYGRYGERGEIAAAHVWYRVIPAYLVEHLIGTGDVGR